MSTAAILGTSARLDESFQSTKPVIACHRCRFWHDSGFLSLATDALAEGHFQMPFAVTGDRIQGSLQAKMVALRQRLARVGTNGGGRLPHPMMAVGTALTGVQRQTIAPMLSLRQRTKSCKPLLNNNSSCC